MESFVVSNGYFLIFLMMVIEGPVITTAAAFAASLGYLNIWLIFALAILGELVGDTLHFLLGRVVRKPFIERYGHYIGLDAHAIVKLERQLRKNLGRAVLAVKLTPVAGIGILLAGALKVSWRKFLWLSLIITVPRVLFFTLLGFFFGWAVSAVLKYFAWGEYSLLALALFVTAFYLVFRKSSTKIQKWSE